MRLADISPSGAAKEALLSSFKNFYEDEARKSKENAAEKIMKMTEHNNALFFSTCGSAIFSLFKFLKEKKRNLKLLAPDQGIWKGIPGICENLRIKITELPTELGLFKVEEAEKIIRREAKNSDAALIFSSFSGYIAEQRIKEIAELCRSNGILLIEDASAAIGDENFGKKQTGDVILCSCGYPKIINLYAGGFLACSSESIADELRFYEKIFRFPMPLFPALEKELDLARKRIDALVKACFKIKRRIKNSIFPEHRSISSAFLCSNPKKLAKVAYEMGIRTEKGKSLLTPCPRYERFLEKGIVIEVKKIDILNTEEKDINNLADKINELLKDN